MWVCVSTTMLLVQGSPTTIFLKSARWIGPDLWRLKNNGWMDGWLHMIAFYYLELTFQQPYCMSIIPWFFPLLLLVTSCFSRLTARNKKEVFQRVEMKPKWYSIAAVFLHALLLTTLASSNEFSWHNDWHIRSLAENSSDWQAYITGQQGNWECGTVWEIFASPIIGKSSRRAGTTPQLICLIVVHLRAAVLLWKATAVNSIFISSTASGRQILSCENKPVALTTQV